MEIKRAEEEGVKNEQEYQDKESKYSFSKIEEDGNVKERERNRRILHWTKQEWSLECGQKL